ncbi:MAG: hypothetical protein E5W56_12655 [Mesorhizobium sp.]|nr:hypothetical protein EN874_021505 [Mesorhizobium sp. M1D.F.Ca.ET.231.01.1.1]TGP30557.1 hypothetical protein EN877_19885 [Mesorhizobium sp. M1D.F.Ca.ET.234.01.1.1]TGS44632.1 hypothetical protein EN827_19880 [Mesorhizobium sp. M1D.F.Ca.ET.184.01.1.1]TGS60672.1 hypothetical protein EN826_019880 [Mesorhizobium sp. M1D.F.Ca.ET.183.01.1.1]TIT72560.1 MAG: hypothetical protein E5W57_29715 [Mesorhizobium sp.]
MVDGPGRAFLQDRSSGSGGHIQLFRRFVTPSRLFFAPWHHHIAVVSGCASLASFLSGGKCIPQAFPR